MTARSLEAQRATPAPSATAPRTLPGEVRGRVSDGGSTHRIGSGSVTVRRPDAQAFAGGALLSADGSFRVDGLAPGTYEVRVRAIGYAPQIRDHVVITVANPVVDLGNIVVAAVAQTLGASKTVAERADVVISPDRTTYAVKNMTVASGGTALDVLRHVPLLEVDGPTGVTLRGNANVVVQVNGRALPLHGDQLAAFLASVPAASVKNVEVATNPSAKEDPEGTAGIINLALNQDVQLGLSGGLTAGTSSTGLASLSGNVGQERGRVILFASGSVSRDDRPVSGAISRAYEGAVAPVFSDAVIDGRMRPWSAGGTLRSQVRVAPRATLSFDGYGFSRHLNERLAAHYVNSDARHTAVAAYDQLTVQRVQNAMLDLAVAYRQTDGKNQPHVSTELEYSRSHGPTDNEIAGTIALPGDSVATVTATERDRNIGTLPFLNWKADYTASRGTTKLEAGVKATHRTTTNDFGASLLDPTGAYVTDPLRQAGFHYAEDIEAGYLLLSNRGKKLVTQAGLRLEDAATYLDVAPGGQRFDRRYASVYPNAIVAWSITPLRSAQVSYSRRVTRPSPFQLTSFGYRTDAMHVTHGNPDLRAEYTNAFEGSVQETRSWGTVQLAPYVRSTAHAMRSIGYIDSTGVSVGTAANVASLLTVGADLNLTAHAGPVRLGGGGSVYHIASDASNLNGVFGELPDLSVRAWVWSTRANGTWVISPKADVQIAASYRAPYATEGGSQLASVIMSGAARYKIWGEAGDISLRVSDPFGLQKNGHRNATGRIVESLWMLPGTRAVTLTITRNFGRGLKLQQRQPDQDAVMVTP